MLFFIAVTRGDFKRDIICDLLTTIIYLNYKNIGYIFNIEKYK